MQGNTHECSCKGNVSQSFTFRAGRIDIRDLELSDIEISFSVDGIPADTYSKLVDILYQFLTAEREVLRRPKMEVTFQPKVDLDILKNWEE